MQSSSTPPAKGSTFLSLVQMIRERVAVTSAMQAWVAVAVVALRQPRRVQRRNGSREALGLWEELQRCTRCYSSQPDEFHLAEQISAASRRPAGDAAPGRRFKCNNCLKSSTRTLNCW